MTRNKTHRSGFETTIDNQLKHSGVPYEYESEKFKYTKECTYTPDFVLDFGTHKIYIEAKGYWTGADRSKLLSVKKENPDMDLRLVFMRDNKLHKKSNTTYTQWATKHGFPCVVGSIPSDWLVLPKKKKDTTCKPKRVDRKKL